MAGISKSEADELLSDAYFHYSRLIEKFCAVRLKEARADLDDCVQNTFLLYYKKILAGEEIINTKAFLYRVADNMVKRAVDDYYRNAKRTVELEKAEHITVENQVESELESIANLDYDLLKEKLLQKLSEDEQKLFELKYARRLSLKEISDIYNINPAAVANRTSRLRTKIKALVDDTIELERNGGSLI